MRIWLVVVLLLFASGGAMAHAERETSFPPGDKEVPVYRDSGPYFVVCKDDSLQRLRNLTFAQTLEQIRLWNECQDRGYEHVQAAVDAVPARGWRILMQPGLYLEEPSKAFHAEPPADCAPLVERKILEYDEHVACPNLQNTVAILGDRDGDGVCGTRDDEVLCDLQIEGVGAPRDQIILDAEWVHLNGLRADRADGIYLKHFTVQRTDFNSVYILETDGFVIDDHLTRWNFEYGYLTFAVDHGLYTDCESYGNGDSGIYPGSASDLRGARHSVEIRYCDSHHNALGYSGTAGNSVWVHHTKFHHNAVGIATDSLFPDHPGLPQDSARFENNWIYSNNENYFDNWLPGGPCHEELPDRGIENGTVCPVIPLPVGSGILIAGGNSNVVRANHIWDNWRYGTMLFTVPAFFRGEDGGLDALCALSNQDPACFDDADPEDLIGDLLVAFDTSHENKYVENMMGIDPEGNVLPNGQDHWWDEGGRGNCWERNVYGDGAPRQDLLGAPTDFILMLPSCGELDALQIWRPPHARLLSIVPCNDFSQPSNTHPTGCTWMDSPEPPA